MTRLDLTGNRFGSLIVKEESASVRTGIKGDVRRRWLCICDCGQQRVVTTNKLRQGKTVHCGCLEKEVRSASKITHGHGGKANRTPEYTAWSNMKDRCFNHNSHAYMNYGGRGITVCEAWRNSFLTFLVDTGLRPQGMTLDRIDVNGHYSCGRCEQCIRNEWPANCRWTGVEQQANNTRANVLVMHGGTKMTLAQACVASGAKYGTVYDRMKRNVELGWGITVTRKSLGDGSYES